MTISELIRLLSDIAEVAVITLLAYVAYKIALLLETLDSKIKEDKSV